MVRRLCIVGLLVLSVVFLPRNGWSKVTGPCSHCHTMHNSQGGQAVVSGGPNEVLLVSDCVGCHTNSSDSSTIVNGTPIVFNANSEPDYPTNGTSSGSLAGGNFYWVAQSGGDAKGHNVKGVTSTDDSSRFSTIPGSDTPYYWLTCAGASGCHGDRNVSDEYRAVYGAHHEVSTVIDGSTVGTSYRFLKGILGKEDSDWEQTVSNADHNQYKGVDRNSETEDDPTTISHLCAECHGDFHNGSGNISANSWGSPWVRHPTDYAMPKSSEYQYYYYKVKGDNLYNPLVPLASADVSSVVSTIAFTGDSIVMCLSCHRAHGSPYDSIMRWDYKNWPGSVENGCLACHTSKD